MWAMVIAAALLVTVSVISGIGLWRQLPAGTNGAYRLMANILSLGTAPGPSRPGATARAPR